MLLKRSKEEVVLLMLCGLSIPSILPFGIVRLFQGNFLMAAVDLLIVLGMLCIMVFVWRTRRVRLAGIAVTVFYSLGMLAAIYVKGVPIVYWVYPTMIAAFFILRAREALLINSVSLLCLIAILHGAMQILDLSSLVVTLVLVNLFSYIFSDRTSLQHFELNQQAEKDFLTGAGNRRAFDKQLQTLCAKDVVQTDACILILDLDHFKKINDQFGHTVGDQVLIQFCSLMRSRIRNADSFFRYGGEEFVIVAMGADVFAAARFAEELRSLIEKAQLLRDYPVTVSIGVAKKIADEEGEAWFQRADAKLYEAKLSGRNAVRVAME
ncbi:GGDEF domain-containing protein [Undibacterium umbellatum]|uniref:diguanylate cyclase n=1 Tax=Undibacterium umbellatum TaxID=2762300 RepID=A0ABR6ZCC0_9BURK|nr:GGDEF domain-containing protein [Undibacterium umbellatum]MBC3909249.1 GGDEF domain-containing protein [Undibacterium umbellatum]